MLLMVYEKRAHCNNIEVGEGWNVNKISLDHDAHEKSTLRVNEEKGEFIQVEL